MSIGAMSVRPAAALSEAQLELLLPMATIVKAALRVEVGNDDELMLVEAYRRAAVDWVERYTAQSMIERAWVASFGGFDGRLRLPRGPVSAVTSVGYRDSAGVGQVLAGAGWRLAGNELWPGIGTAWPAALCGAGSVTVTFTAGFADAATEVPTLVTAMLLAIGHWFRNREAVVTGTITAEVPFGARVLADLHRVPVIG